MYIYIYIYIYLAPFYTRSISALSVTSALLKMKPKVSQKTFSTVRYLNFALCTILSNKYSTSNTVFTLVHKSVASTIFTQLIIYGVQLMLQMHYVMLP